MVIIIEEQNMEFKTYINNITVVLEKNRIMLPLGEKNSLGAKMKKKSSMTTNKTENRNIKKNQQVCMV